MKKYFTLTLSIFFCILSGCANTQDKYSKLLDLSPSASGLEETHQESQPIAELNQPSWNQFKLVSIVLNQDKKPQKSVNHSLQITDEFIPFDNGPKIHISEFNINSDKNGRIIHIACHKIDIKQKFNLVEQTNGWAVEIQCNDISYFFLINHENV